ncbi:MAG: LCP family protein [Sciscionella sp.]|nr:LCP family protein [Sciscionella sp.]
MKQRPENAGEEPTERGHDEPTGEPSAESNTESSAETSAESNTELSGEPSAVSNTEPNGEPSAEPGAETMAMSTGAHDIDAEHEAEPPAEPPGHATEPVSAATKYRMSSKYNPQSRRVESSDPDARIAVARHGANPLLIAGRTLVALLAVLALAVTGYAWLGTNTLRHSTNTTNAINDYGSAPGAPPVNDDSTDILLVGSDNRTDMQGNPLPENILKELRTTLSNGVNTDTIILLHIPNKPGKAYAISIPRDTYVAIPGSGHDDKINAAYATMKRIKKQQLEAGGENDQKKIEQESDEAGQGALIESVQNLTGLHIDHYAEINLYGFYQLSQAIGGVDVCLRQATKDKDSGANFRRGWQTISGSDALSFVRQRENLPDGDIDRIQRQQVFLASAMKKLLSVGTLTSPSKLSQLADVAKSSLVIDSGLDILSFAQQAADLTSGNVEFVTIPITSIYGHSPTGQSIVSVNVDAVHEFVHQLTGSPVAAAPASATPSVDTPSAGDDASPAPASSAPNTPPNTSANASPSRPPTSAAASPAAPTSAPEQTEPPLPPVTTDGQRCVY